MGEAIAGFGFILLLIILAMLLVYSVVKPAR